MTEAEWRACDDPDWMLSFAETRLSDRKARLYGVACCHRIWHLLHERYQNAVEVAERFADEVVDRAELDTVAASAWSGPSYSLGRSLAAADAAGEALFRKDGFGIAYHLRLLT